MKRLVEYLQNRQDDVECSSLSLDVNNHGYYLPPKKHTQNSRLTHFQASISIIQVNVGSWRKNIIWWRYAWFQGKHSLKYVIKFKKDGDGYLFDFIGEEGFIYTFFLRTTPAPQKWVDKGFFPTIAIVLFLFEQLSCKFHIWYLENSFMFTNICCTTYVELKAKVKIHGVTISKDRGLPIFFMKQEDTEKIKKARAIGTI